MTDMSQFISPKSDQLNSDDLIGGPRTITVARVTATPGSPEQPVSIHFEGDGGKPYKPCKSMRRVMVHVWGADASQYVGRSMTIYRDPAVAFGGMQVGGIRISHMTDMAKDEVMALTVTKARRAPYTVKRLEAQLTAAPQNQSQPPAPLMTPGHAIACAKAEAGKGTEHFRAWFNSEDGKNCRHAADGALDPKTPALSECAVIAQGADNLAARLADDPFPPTAATDPEIEAQIRAEQAARDAELEGRA